MPKPVDQQEVTRPQQHDGLTCQNILPPSHLQLQGEEKYGESTALSRIQFHRGPGPSQNWGATPCPPWGSDS